jgi:hypothetical protein
MSDYIREAIEVVRKKALISKARLEREREIARVASGASFEDAQPDTPHIDEAALMEFERIERLTAAALHDYDAVYGARGRGGETEAGGGPAEPEVA